MLYTGADTGFIAQNVYLFCASEGLAVSGAGQRRATRTRKTDEAPPQPENHPGTDRGYAKVREEPTVKSILVCSETFPDKGRLLLGVE